MSHRDVDRIASLLSQCLGRIDSQAAGLGDGLDDDQVDLRAQALEAATESLQELVDELTCLVQEPSQGAEVLPILRRVLAQTVAGLRVPIMVREQFAAALPQAACTPEQLHGIVHRALQLAVQQLTAGDELRVQCHAAGDRLLFEVASRCQTTTTNLGDRATTLREFVLELGGECAVAADEQGHLLLALELPAALVSDG